MITLHGKTEDCERHPEGCMNVWTTFITVPPINENLHFYISLLTMQICSTKRGYDKTLK